MSDKSAQVLQPAGWSPPSAMPTASASPPAASSSSPARSGWDAEEKFHSEELVPQFEQALKNIIAIVAAAGGEPKTFCRITAFCIDKPAYLAGRREIGRIWRALMGKHFVAMSMIFVADLLDHPAKVELEATAVIPAE